ncbi:probable receptor-like protein kinase At1g49730 [Mercurialis annua]|uniref:probable receptor-like protein kinase At1g49730 n=1 Tax=Mercurialis annua TaxID=3986 RepID=UPI00215FDEEB|nr:probable receptor-like protein kinase At1g49730 [Mercurialis annua]
MDPLIRKIRPHLLAWLRRSRSGQISFIRRFSYQDVRKATDGFRRILYSDSDGTAFKAKFQDGAIAFVKEIKHISQHKHIFYREAQLLGRLNHRHLLALKGFSVGRKRLLIFDNIENGSLKEHLNDPLKTPLNWKTRLRIATGVAAALEYLLIFSNPPMYHVSISSSNIMLDENFTAKLSNIGFVSSVENVTTPTPHASCTTDCMAQSCGKLIYELGVLILELVTGQSSEKGSADLVQWVRGSCFRSSMLRMIDPDLGNSYDSRELQKLLAVARLCINSGNYPKFSILQVFRYLQKS